MPCGSTKDSNQQDKSGENGHCAFQDLDHSILQHSFNLGVTNVQQILKCVQNGSKEIKDLILNECNVIYECKVCANLFRSLANFLYHKRCYCKNHLCEGMQLFENFEEAPTVVVHPEPPDKGPAKASDDPPRTTECTVELINMDDEEVEALSNFQGEPSVPKEKVGKNKKSKEPTVDESKKVDKPPRTTSPMISRRTRLKNSANASKRALKFVPEPEPEPSKRSAKSMSKANTLKTATERVAENSLALNESKEQKKVKTGSLKASELAKLKETATASKPAKSSSHIKVNELDGEKDDITTLSTSDDGKPENKTIITEELDNSIANNPKLTEKSPKQMMVKPVTKKIILRKPNTIELKGSVLSTIRKSVSTNKLGFTNITNASGKNLQCFPQIVFKTIDGNPHAVFQSTDKAKSDSIAFKGKTDGSKTEDKLVIVLNKDTNTPSTEQTPTLVSPPKTSKSPTEFHMTRRKRLLQRTDCNVAELKCINCNAQFTSLKTLYFHMLSIHSKKRLYYPCPFCKTLFVQMYGVTRHLVSIHNKTKEQINKLRDVIKKRSIWKKVDDISLKEEGVLQDESKPAVTMKEAEVKEVVPVVKPKEVIPGVTPEKVLLGVKPEKVIPGVKSEPVLPGVKPEKVLPGVTPEKGLLGVKPEKVIPEVKSEPVLPGVKPEKVLPEVTPEKGLLEVKSEKVLPEVKEPLPKEETSNCIRETTYKSPIKQTTEVAVHNCSKCGRAFGRKSSQVSHEKFCIMNAIKVETVDLTGGPISPPPNVSFLSLSPKKVEPVPFQLPVKQHEKLVESKVSTRPKRGAEKQMHKDFVDSQTLKWRSPKVSTAAVKKPITKTIEKKVMNIMSVEKLLCTKCNKTFSSYSNLRRHVAIHVGWHRFKCKYCEYQAYNKSNVWVHVQKAHSVPEDELEKSVLNIGKNPMNRISKSLPGSSHELKAKRVSLKMNEVPKKHLKRRLSLNDEKVESVEADPQKKCSDLKKENFSSKGAIEKEKLNCNDSTKVSDSREKNLFFLKREYSTLRKEKSYSLDSKRELTVKKVKIEEKKCVQNPKAEGIPNAKSNNLLMLSTSKGEEKSNSSDQKTRPLGPIFKINVPAFRKEGSNYKSVTTNSPTTIILSKKCSTPTVHSLLAAPPESLSSTAAEKSLPIRTSPRKVEGKTPEENVTSLVTRSSAYTKGGTVSLKTPSRSNSTEEQMKSPPVFQEKTYTKKDKLISEWFPKKDINTNARRESAPLIIGLVPAANNATVSRARSPGFASEKNQN